jgi:hypothetical protein
MHRSESNEKSYNKVFPLALDKLTVWTDFQGLFELLSAKMPWRRNKTLLTVAGHGNL